MYVVGEQECLAIAIDLKGYGESTYNKKVSSYQEIAEELKEMMEAEFPLLPGYSIFGYDIGA